MSKRALLRLATSICFMFCVIFLGNIAVFANEVKPIHEYNFEKDNGTNVVDTGSDVYNGSSRGTNRETFFTGYKSTGVSRYFNGIDDFLNVGGALKSGAAKSVRFKVKKDPSTVSNKIEAIISSSDKDIQKGYFIGVGSESLNDATANYAKLNAKAGTLYIVSFYNYYKINFEIQTPESVCDGKWHDILFTWDGTTSANSVKLYLDNMSTPVAQTTAKSKSEVSWTGTTIGVNASGEYFYNGYLDNVQFYDSAITPSLDASSNLKATGGISKIELTWDAVDKATSYTVKRATTAGGPYTTITTEITETSYTDTDVTSGTTYYYIVSAINAGAEIGNSNEASAQPTESQTPPITDSKLKVVLEVAESLRLSVDDDLNVNTQMSWTSSEPTVATVNEKGIVTALAPGNTVITVKSVDGSYTDYINVLVVENADDYRLAIDLKIGETARLTADNFTNTANITWAPMDSAIANVTTKGKVTALSKGLVLISAKDAEGNIIGRVYVRVRE